MAKPKRVFIANWKMYVTSQDEAKAFAAALRRRVRAARDLDVGIAPPFPFIPALAQSLKGSGIGVGAQTVSAEVSGAHTGEVSAAMLSSIGATFAIVGHSERRAQGDGDDAVREALSHSLAAGLRAVLAIGERVRDREHGSHFEALHAQLRSALSKLPRAYYSKLIVAYEPVWAIGKSAQEAMQPSELRETVIFIRKTLADLTDRTVGMRLPILYGGSVEPENAASLLQGGDVSGFLIGHASVSADDFLAIIRACAPAAPAAASRRPAASSTARAARARRAKKVPRRT